MSRKKLDKYVVHQDAPMMTVLDRINSNAAQSVFIVDDNGRLVGSLTDGDIRRALLNKKPVNDLSAKDLMNKSVLYLPDSTQLQQRVNFMHRMGIRQLPIIDDENVITDVLLSEGMRETVLADVKVVLMAGGLGTRLRPITETIPKPMVEVNDRPIMEHVIDHFVNEGFHRFIASVNYKSEIIKEHFGDGSRFNVEIEYIDEEKRMGTAGSLSLMSDRLTQTFFVTNCDLITGAPFYNMYMYHQDHSALATMAVREQSHHVPFGMVDIQGFSIRKITEKPNLTFHINAGFYVLDAGILKYIPHNTQADMPDVVNTALQAGEYCIAYPTQDYWIDIGNPEDLERAKREID